MSPCGYQRTSQQGPHVATSLMNYAALLRKPGRNDEAEKL